jgi:hypothetical protein
MTPRVEASLPNETHNTTSVAIKKLDLTKIPTDQQYASSEQKFYGAYGQFRKGLDYTYHTHYQKQRQWLHDSILEDLLEGSNDETFLQETGRGDLLSSCCWLVLTVGVKGAGKRYAVDQLALEGRLVLPNNTIMIDTDEIRRLLPEYNYYLQTCPATLDQLLRKENGYIAETLLLAALHERRSVIWDTSLQSASWFAANMTSFKQDEHGGARVKLGMIYVTAPLDCVRKRQEQVAKETERTISMEATIETLSQLPSRIAIVKPVMDCYFSIQNNDDGLVLNNGCDWSDFSRAFASECVVTNNNAPTIDSSCEAHSSPRTSLIRRRGIRRSLCGTAIARSSTECHAMKELVFYGKYANIRKSLDYSYHSNYTAERQCFQDAVIDYFVRRAIVTDKNGEVCTTPTEPWIVFTAGAMGAGKSHTMKRLVEMERFPLLAFINVDPDAIRRFLPEFAVFVQQKPELAGELTRKEAGYISEILTHAGLQAGKNVLVDGSLRDADWYKTYFGRLRQEWPALRISILHIVAPAEAVYERAKVSTY